MFLSVSLLITQLVHLSYTTYSTISLSPSVSLHTHTHIIILQHRGSLQSSLSKLWEVSTLLKGLTDLSVSSSSSLSSLSLIIHPCVYLKCPRLFFFHLLLFISTTFAFQLAFTHLSISNSYQVSNCSRNLLLYWLQLKEEELYKWDKYYFLQLIT